MSRWYERVLWLALALLGLRLLGMAWVPLADTSEPRYAEIARLMAVSGDWITPWFEPGQPFWGKPPLAFWAQALSMKIFGISEWAGRLPSCLAMLVTLVAIHALARAYAGRRAANWAVLIYVTSLLPYIAAGAVLTDPFLVLGTTLCMAGMVLPQRHWRVLAWLGLAIGLLAKGPLAVVLVGGPALLCWLAWRGRAWPAMPGLGWLPGVLMVLMLALPWYILAEWKTPGFLDYFLVGEHLRRYLDPGWAGDMYGTAHLQPYGSIWLQWLLATFPWGAAGLALLLHACASQAGRQHLRQRLRHPRTGYLLAWAVFTPAFFTLSGNVLWTYVLPALPAFAILMGRAMALVSRRWRPGLARLARNLALAAALLVPVVGLAAGMVLAGHPQLLKTEKELVRYVQDNALPGTPLLYVDSRPFSARYYSRGEAGLVTAAQLLASSDAAGREVYVAIPRELLPGLAARMPLETVPQAGSKKYMLARVHTGANAVVDQAPRRMVAGGLSSAWPGLIKAE